MHAVSEHLVGDNCEMLREVIRGNNTREFLCVLIVLHGCGEFGSQTETEGFRKRNLPHVYRIVSSIK